MRSHGEVRNSSDHRNRSSNIVKDPVLTRLHMREEEKYKCSGAHECADCKVYAGAIIGESNVSDITINEFI